MGPWGCVLLLVMSGLVVLFKVLSFEVTGRNFRNFDTCLEIHRGECVQHRTWTQSHANDPRHRDPTMALRNHYFHKQHQISTYFDVTGNCDTICHQPRRRETHPMTSVVMPKRCPKTSGRFSTVLELSRCNSTMPTSS